MMKFTLLAIGILPIVLFAQNKASISTTNKNYTVTVNTPELEAKKVFLKFRLLGLDGVGIDKIDSAVVKNGSAFFNGSVPYAVYAEIENSDRSFSRLFWLENSNIKIKRDDQKGFQVVGSQTEDELIAYHNFTDFFAVKVQVSAKNKEIQQAKKDGDDVALARIQDEKKLLVDNWEAKGLAFFEAHPDSYFSLNWLYNKAGIDKIPYEQLFSGYNKLTARVRESMYAKVIERRLTKMKMTIPGQAFPAYNQPDMNGNLVNVSDYKGKYVLLTFGGTWVTGYRKENALKLDLFNQYHQKGFDLLDVMLDKNKEKILEMIESDKLPWKIVSDLKGWNGEASEKLAIENIPRNFLIDRNGVVIATSIYGDELVQKVKELLK